MGDAPQVDLGLAAAGDAVEQERGERAGVDGCGERDQGRCLLIRERRRTVGSYRVLERVPVDLPLTDGYEAGCQELLQLRPAGSEAAAELPAGGFTVCLEKLQDVEGLPPEFFRREVVDCPIARLSLQALPLGKDLARDRGAVGRGGGLQPSRDRQSRRQGSPDHFSQGVEVVGGDPAIEPQILFAEERLPVQDLPDLPAGFGSLSGMTEDVACHGSPAERDQYPAAGDCRWHQVWRNAIGEGLVDWQGNGNVNEMGGV